MSELRTYYLALDLRNDAEAIAALYGTNDERSAATGGDCSMRGRRGWAVGGAVAERARTAFAVRGGGPAMGRYERCHREDHFWPEIADSIHQAGIRDMEIYRTGNRLFMVMTVSPSFSFEKKAALDAGNKKVQEWGSLMERFQQRLPWTPKDGKWERMDRIFSLPPPGR